MLYTLALRYLREHINAKVYAFKYMDPRVYKH